MPRRQTPTGRRQSRLRVAADACRTPCREVLRRFLLLRAQVDGESLFDCKTSDFVAFTSAVMLLFSHMGPTASEDANGRTEDWGLISLAEQVFLREERRTGCKMAAQCRRALAIMRDTCSGNSHGPVDISIPLFGRVTMTPRSEPLMSPKGHSHQPAPASHAASQSTRTEPIVPSTMESQGTLMDDGMLFIPDVGMEITDWLSSTFEGTGVDGNPDSWFALDPAMAGLDQDWASWPLVASG